MNRLFTDLESLRTLAIENGGMLDVRVGALRDATGAGRLGCNVRARIARWLHRGGFGWLPDLLPNDQEHLVTLYVRDSAAGKALEVARHVRDADARLQRVAK